MPPKRKSGKKKKGQKSGKKPTPPARTTQGEQLSELSKEFYLLQIRDLENRLGRYQRKCDELDVSNGGFHDQFEQMATDKKEIVEFLKKSLGQRGDEIQDLHDRLIGLQQAKDSEKDQYEQQLKALRTEFQETKDELTSENMILGGKLASLEEFKVQKEDLLAKMAALEDDLKEQEAEHQEDIYKLERKQVVDKDRLKKEMVMRVNQVAAEFRKVSNKQMAETTKRTIRENVSINAQLAKMSDKTMELIQENDDLRAKEKKQRQLIDLLEANEKELAKKNHSNQKIIRMLTEKCKGQEALLEEYELREDHYSEQETESDLLRRQVESTREELQSLCKENEQLDEDLTEARADLEQERKDKRKVEQVLADAATALKNALTTRSSEDVEESAYDKVEKRDTMLEHLLILLNSAAAVGVGPTPSAFAEAQDEDAEEEEEELRDRRPISSSKIPGSGKGLKRGDVPTSPIAKVPGGTLPHYQLGDLGLIPRPKEHIPTRFEQMKDLSATTRLGTIKKVLTKSVAVQTVSTPKAMFFADQLLSKMPATNHHLLHDVSPRGEQPMFPQLVTPKKAHKVH